MPQPALRAEAVRDYQTPIEQEVVLLFEAQGRLVVAHSLCPIKTRQLCASPAPVKKTGLSVAGVLLRILWPLIGKLKWKVSSVGDGSHLQTIPCFFECDNK